MRKHSKTQMNGLMDDGTSIEGEIARYIRANKKNNGAQDQVLIVDSARDESLQCATVG